MHHVGNESAKKLMKTENAWWKLLFMCNALMHIIELNCSYKTKEIILLLLVYPRSFKGNVDLFDIALPRVIHKVCNVRCSTVCADFLKISSSW